MGTAWKTSTPPDRETLIPTLADSVLLQRYPAVPAVLAGRRSLSIFLPLGARLGACIGNGSAVENNPMASLGKSAILLRLCTAMLLVSYLLAGASLVLPAESRCTRCDRLGSTSTMKPGASCPLSHKGHDCHNAQGKTVGHITLCPEGGLHHDGQNGEIPSLAKFLSAPDANVFTLLPAGFIPGETLSPIPDFSLSPPEHPPPSHS
jgi:hypothetical protein